MVTNITSLTGNGLKDWLIQRVTAVYLAVYVFFIIAYLVNHPGLAFIQWSTFFDSMLIKSLTILAAIAFSLHTWIGIWTVTTDYITCTAVRLSVQLAVLAWLIVQFLLCLMIVWGH